MPRKENAKAEKYSRKSKSAQGDKKMFLSDRQKKVFLILLIAMFILVPAVDLFNVFRCKAACLKRIKTPYPEIACKYQCPWPWERK